MNSMSRPLTSAEIGFVAGGGMPSMSTGGGNTTTVTKANIVQNSNIIVLEQNAFAFSLVGAAFATNASMIGNQIAIPIASPPTSTVMG